MDAITADMVFPLLFDVAEPEVRRRVEQRLLSAEFWTPHGARTVGGDQPEYDPDAGSQLLGGVWPNLTAWIAFAARRSRPEVVAEALTTIYRIAEVEVPALFGHVVPGEFPERMSGDSGVSRGMALSPWMPPTYLWLAISGLSGVEVGLEGLRIEPALPPGCEWILLRGLPYAGGRFSLVLWRGAVHTSAPAASSWPLFTYEADCSDQVELHGSGPGCSPAPGPGDGQSVQRCPHGRVGVLALRQGSQAAIFVAREGTPDQPVEGAVAVTVRWKPAGGRAIWSGNLAGGEALRLVVRWETGEVLEQEQLAPATSAAVPRPAA